MMIIKYSVKISASLEEKMNSNWLILRPFQVLCKLKKLT